MKSTLIWLILAGAVLLLGDSVDAWNRQMFNRYSRNLFRKGGEAASGAGGGNNDIDDFNSLFGIGGGDAGGMGKGGVGAGAASGQQQGEIYGIVEPLIEDTPCADRPCNLNDDCCPTGVCVNTYGEGKCIYVYGRKRDQCHRNTDCEPGMLCLKGAAGNFICLPSGGGGLSGSGGAPRLHIMDINGGAEAKSSGGTELDARQFSDECVSSWDCRTDKNMCCQLQRMHHRSMPRKKCVYIRDPFKCIDIMPPEDEEIRESRFLSSFSQRRM